MKLPTGAAGRMAAPRGNPKHAAKLVETPGDGLSDRSSILLTSTRWTLHEHLLFQRRLCRKGAAVMSKRNARGARCKVPCPPGVCVCCSGIKLCGRQKGLTQQKSCRYKGPHTPLTKWQKADAANASSFLRCASSVFTREGM